MKKLILMAMVGTMVFASGCGADAKNDETGDVRFLNYKAEADEAWKELAVKYEEETGVKVTVITAPGAGQYETTLKSELAKEEAPTLFQINGPMGYLAWKDYCADLTETGFYDKLSDKTLAITGEDEGVYGVPYAIEGYGIVYNKAVLDKYFETTTLDIKSVDEIDSFDDLKAVTEDMQANKDALGIEGVFASTSLLPGEDWRWNTHLANIPIYHEYTDKNVSSLDEIEFTYNESFKNIFDLYANNSVVDKKMLGSKTVMDSVTEFALGKAAMIQNGQWVWQQISETEGTVLTEDTVGFLPIYTGAAEDEADMGLCVGTENYFSVNAKASEVDQKATIEFLDWLVSSDLGKDYMVNNLGIAAPFNTFSDEEKPQDPLAKSVLEFAENGKVSVPWVFATFPSQDFKNVFGNALLEYVQESIEWDEVVQETVDAWASEMSKIKK